MGSTGVLMVVGGHSQAQGEWWGRQVCSTGWATGNGSLDDGLRGAGKGSLDDRLGDRKGITRRRGEAATGNGSLDDRLGRQERDPSAKGHMDMRLGWGWATAQMSQGLGDRAS